MEFYEKFSKYSNVELLKILYKKEEYQPLAIETAKSILSDRNVSKEEQQEVDDFFLKDSLEKARQDEKINSLKDHLKDITDPFLYPVEKVELGKWIKILLVSIIIQYVYSIYQTIIFIYQSIKNSISFIGINSFLHLIQLVYISTLFYLIYRKSRRGWILLFIFSFVYFIFSIPSAYSYLRMIYYFGIEVNPGQVIFSVFINGATLFFLWRKEVADYFKISKASQIKTLKIAIIITISIILFMIISINNNN